MRLPRRNLKVMGIIRAAAIKDGPSLRGLLLHLRIQVIMEVAPAALVAVVEEGELEALPRQQQNWNIHLPTASCFHSPAVCSRRN